MFETSVRVSVMIMLARTEIAATKQERTRPAKTLGA
jgi:hypothetical protein